MDCFIIDDEQMARDSLKWHCSKIDTLNIKGEFSNPIEAMEELEKNCPDLIFLDIHMPELTGIELLKNLTMKPKVILTTTDSSFALDSYEYDVVDYLIKPFNFPRFLKAYNKVIGQIEQVKHQSPPENETANELYVNINKKLIRIPVGEVLFVEACGDYAKIKTSDSNHVVHTTMKKIIDKLPQDKFQKVHRSFIVNLSKIVDIQDNSILIEDKVIPVSRSNKQALLKRLNMI